MESVRAISDRLRPRVDRRRLLETAERLVGVPSRTGEAGAAAALLAALLEADGFDVERPEAGHAPAPAVAVRLRGGRPGRTLQFDGHLDTVHLPFVPPRVEDDLLRGSGAADMKAGIAAAVEALRALRDAGEPRAGGILFTAHDLHEAPWGFGQQLDRLIDAGYVGDAVLLPEPLADRLPVVGRGAATWHVTLRRPGPPVHEVMRPADEPDVLAAGAELVTALAHLDARLAERTDPRAGRASVFVGQIHGGSIYNQVPRECQLEGTRRWLPGTAPEEVKAEFRALITDLERRTKATADVRFQLIRDGFALDEGDRIVAAFQDSYRETSGAALPVGAKPFVDDGNSFWSRAHVPAITHGPRAGGQHTLQEWVAIDDLVRVAHLYALTAVLYCQEV
ncbi:MAG TPA: M20/M25/M40 family metallo-hydrolase [Isosphaeraceae bacterium]|jgi:acetylornithine deacetylase/succinyl-diaminopimelate desuccinylase-like protein